MQYTIHGKKINYDGQECGIYKPSHGGLCTDYAAMDVNNLVRVLNSMPKDAAISGLATLKDQAFEQSKWQTTPKNAGFPILRGPESTPINDVRRNIKNLHKFADDVLNALKGK